MRMKHFISKIILVVIATRSYGEPLKKGRVMCEGAACRSREVSSDFVSRVRKRMEITKTPSAQVEMKKSHGTSARGVLENRPAKTQITNLPQYFEGNDRSKIEASEKVVFVPKSSEPHLKGMKPGDIVWAVIDQEIIASSSQPTPVRAMVVSGNFKGAVFLGEAVLDHELKRVLLNFTKLKIKEREHVFSIKAIGLAPKGSLGLEGEYVSQSGKFSIAEFVSVAGTGFIDSTVSRNQTSLGTYVQEPSVSNSGKIAAVTALSKTAERMTDAARYAPEYTKTPGYQEIQVIIQDEPVEMGAYN